MIPVVKAEPLSMEGRALAGRHPLGIAGHVLHAVGLALMVGATFAVFAAVAASTTMVVSPLLVVGSAGTSLAGLALIHQGSSLIGHAASGAPQPDAAEPVN